MENRIHPTAIIEDGVQLGAGVSIAAYAVIKRGTSLADGVTVHEHAVIGGPPQDFKFNPETASGVQVGAGSVIREGVTIHRSVHAGSHTQVGKRVFLMANSHVAHDCRLGDDSILANGVLLGGDVTIGQHVFLGGNAVFHQFVRVGDGAIVSGGSRIAHDVPPNVMAEAYSRAAGLNLVGLRRRKVSTEAINDLKRCYRAVFFGSGSPVERARIHQADTDIGKAFLLFFDGSKRGYLKSRIKLSRETDA